MIETYNVLINDGTASTAEVVTITINGTNDVPTVTGTQLGTVTEDVATPATGTITATDLDVNDTLVYSTNDAPAYGAFVMTGATWTYTLDSTNPTVQALGVGETMTEVVNVLVEDGNGGSVTQAVTITITGANDAPVATASPTANIAEDATAPVTGSISYTDVDTNDAHTFSTADTSATGGTFTVDPATGAWSYSVNNANAAVQALAVGETLIETYNVLINDGTASTSEVVTITINGTNDNPVITSATPVVGDVSESNDLTATVTATGTITAIDPDVSDTVQFAVAPSAAYGLITIDAAGQWTYALDSTIATVDQLQQGDTLVETFTVNVTDGNGGSATETITITVHGTNDAPVATQNLTASINEGATTPISGSIAYTDVDNGDTHTFQANTTLTTVHGDFILGTNGSWSYTVYDDATVRALAVGQTLTEVYTVTITDGANATATETVTITINGVNIAPTAADGALNVAEDSTAATVANQGALPAYYDADGDAVTYSLASPAAHGTVTITDPVTGAYTYVPAADYNGPDSFTYMINDGHGGTASYTINITVNGVNDAPVAKPDVATATEDGVVVNSSVATNDTDVDSTVLTYSTASAVAGLTFNADGTYSFDPKDAAYQHLAQGATEVITVDYVVKDDLNASSASTLTITVTGVNDLPIGAPTTFGTNEDTAYSGTLPVGSDVDDGESATLTYLAASQPTHGSVIITNAATGAYTYTPDANYSGTDSFTYSVKDTQGGTNTYTVDITVAGVNDAPVAGDDSNTAIEGGAVVIGSVASNDTDADTPAASLIYALTSTAPAGLTMDSSGTYTFNPADTAYDYLKGGETAVVTVNYSVSDGTASDTAVLSITITGTNDVPVGQDSAISVVEDSPITGTNNAGQVFIATDTDGDSLTYGMLTPAANGLASVDASGNYTYVPNPDFNGADSFVYSVSDGHGGVASYTVTVSVTPVNDAPRASDTGVTVLEDSGANSLMLPTAIDPDGDSVTYAQGSVAPSKGSVSINPDGTYTYTPNANANGTDTFTYTVNDGMGGIASYTVTVAITPVNDAPIASDAAMQMYEDTSFTGALPKGTDPEDGTNVSYTLVTGSTQGGVVSVTPTGQYTYTPAPNYAGPDSFVYSVADQQGLTSTYTITIDVVNVNDPPKAADMSVVVYQDTQSNTGTLPAATDPENNASTYGLQTAAMHGVVSVDPSGNYTYTPTAGYSGTDSFVYYVDDAQSVNHVASYTVTLTVQPISINITEIAGDATVSSGNSIDPILTLTENQSATTTIKGTVHGIFKDGDVVTIKLADGTTASTTVAHTSNSDGTWSVTVPTGALGAAAAGDPDNIPVIASILATDTANGISANAYDSDQYDVDLIVPNLLSLDISSTPTHGTDGATYYVAGEWVYVTATYDDTVVVTGNPAINLEIGPNGSGTVVTAQYDSSVGNQIIFKYQIQGGQYDALAGNPTGSNAEPADGNGIRIVPNTLSANGGTIQDINGNNANNAFTTATNDGYYNDVAVIIDGSKQFVDAIAPTATLYWSSTGDLTDWAADQTITTPVTSPVRVETAGEIAYEASIGKEIGIYKLGDTMYLHMQFNEGVTITNPDNMTLAISLTPNGIYPANLTGYSSQVYAVYDAAHSNLNTGFVSFQYTITAQDLDSPTANGIDALGAAVNANALTLNGAVIADVASNLYDGVLNALAQDKYEYIDGMAPTTTAKIVSWTDNIGFYTGTQTSDYGTGTLVNLFDASGNNLTSAAVNGATTDGDVTTNDPNYVLNLTISTMDTGDSINVYDAATNVLIGTVTLTSGTTAYTFTDTRTKVDQTTYTYYIKVMDIAGNEGTASGQFSVTYDITVPTNYAHITAAVDNYTNSLDQSGVDNGYTGNVTDGQSTNDTTLTIAGTLDSALQEGHRVFIYRTVNGTGSPTLTDPTSPSDLSTLSSSTAIVSGQLIGEVTSFTTDSLGNVTWTFADADTLADGTTYNYFVKVMDDAGNFSVASSDNTSGTSTGLDITIDTTAPGTLTINTVVTDTYMNATTSNTLNHNQNTDLITRDNKVIVTGTSATNANSFVEISFDGGSTWTSTTTDASGVWIFTDTITRTGNVAVMVRAADAASNYSYYSGAFTIDTVAPTQITKAPVLSADSAVNGTTATDQHTSTLAQTFTGTPTGAETGATIGLVNDVNKNGVFDYGIDTILTSGAVGTSLGWSGTAGKEYNLGYIQWDTAGNISRMSDTTQVFFTNNTDLYSATTALTVSGTSARDDIWGIQGTGYNPDGTYFSLWGQSASVYSTLASQTGTNLGYGGNFYQGSKAMIDYNRNGWTDLFASRDTGTFGGSDTISMWTNSSGSFGTAPTALTIATGGTNVFDPYQGSAFGWDQNGDGWVDLVMTSYYAGAAYNGIIYKNVNGTFQAASSTYFGTNIDDGMYGGAIDLDNDGFVDLTISNNAANASLYLLKNTSGTGLSLTQTVAGVFNNTNDDAGDSSRGGMAWGDFNGDGYLDLFVSGNAASTQSAVYMNNAAGGLSTTPVTWVSPADITSTNVYNQLSGVVDWNADGYMDVIESGWGGSPAVSLNNGSGGFSAAKSFSISSTTATWNGMNLMDANWDGTVDALMSDNGNDYIIYNNNTPLDGTSMHVRILDQGGINSYYSNTVQLLNSSGTVVSTQVINEQGGRFGMNDATGIVNFYGLSATETYTVQLIAAYNGAVDIVNGSNNTSWTGLSTTESSSYILSTGGGTAANGATVTGTLAGTGYNDEFFAAAGTVVYQGAGGWVTDPAGTGSTWSTTTGMDVVNYDTATANLTINLSSNIQQTTGFNTATFVSIEGLVAGSGNDTLTDSAANNVFDGRGGNDTYYLTNGGHDTLDFNIVTAGVANGGNGSDTVIGFTLGNIATVANADIVDLTDLVAAYTGNATVYWDVTTSANVVDAASINAGLDQYVNVISGTNTQIQVDATGTGAWSTVLTLNGVNTTLADLIANHQILIA